MDQEAPFQVLFLRMGLR